MKLFVWDFHGTLEKGNEKAVYEISNTILINNGYNVKFTLKQIHLLYGKKWWEYFYFLLPHLSHEKHIELQSQCIAYSHHHPELILKYISIVDNAKSILEQIAIKHDQILISNTTPKALALYIAIVGIEHIFPKKKLFAINSHCKNISKIETLKQYIKNKTYESLIVIGDTYGDIELGRACNAITMLYAHPGKKFITSKADYKIRDLKKVLQLM